jgi:GAF domain-containing protein
MMARLKNAIASARELEALVHELPVLAQPRAMGHAFLGEVVEMFGPQVAAVFAPSVDGAFGVIAAHGLSSVEVGLKVPPDQPLFLEIAQTLEAVLISPVDLAQGLVAGIGGARTEALMAAPLAVGGTCHAIVVVGRHDFTEFDLELLAEQAEEAAPGLAVAQMIDRLRGL